MEIRQITPDFAVSPQIRPADVAALKEAGFDRVICNRPDEEVSGEESSDSIRAACEAAGLSFRFLPVSHTGLDEDLIDAQREAVEEDGAGRVFAYCRSGTRCAHVWALGQAGRRATDEIIEKTAGAGYDLEPMRGTLDLRARAGGTAG